MNENQNFQVPRTSTLRESTIKETTQSRLRRELEIVRRKEKALSKHLTELSQEENEKYLRGTAWRIINEKIKSSAKNLFYFYKNLRATRRRPVHRIAPNKSIQSENPLEKKLTYKKRRIRVLRLIRKWNDTVAAVIGISAMVIAFLAYEEYFTERLPANWDAASAEEILEHEEANPHFEDPNGEGWKYRYQSNFRVEFLRSLVTIGTILVIMFIVVHAILSYYLGIERGVIKNYSNFFKTKYFRFMCIEIFINIIHCPPGLNLTFNADQLDFDVLFSVDTILTSWTLLRVYLGFRLFAQYSQWTNEVAEEFCEPHGAEANTLFAMKAVLKEKPYITLLILMILSTVIFGLGVRNFEYPLNYRLPGGQDYSYMWNGMWLIAITMATVGYGDYFPRTHLGRMVCVIACFWGIFLVSMMVVTLANSSSFDVKENRAFAILFRLNVKQEIQNKASFVVSSIIKILALQKKLQRKEITHQQYLDAKIQYRNDLEIRKAKFTHACNELSIQDWDVSQEELMRQLMEKIDQDFEEIKYLTDGLKEIEAQLLCIRNSQNAVQTSIADSKLYLQQIEKSFMPFYSKLTL